MRKHRIQRLLAGICFLLVGLGSLNVWAVPASFDITQETVEKKEERPSVDSQGKPILLAGETGVLIEQKSGMILYESGAEQRMYPASTTKVMTGLLAIEAVRRGEIGMDEPITVTAQMLEGLDPDGSNIALKADEVLTLKQLLWGLMIPSGNDAAMAIAFRLAGSQEAFAEAMNQRARELGLVNTHFVNPHGLHDDNHYTTAAEMAQIARAAMEYEEFRDIVDIAHIKIPPTNKTEKERYYINTNGLISAMRYLDYVYKGATGIKTGRTDEAGNCLVASATRNGMHLIAVLFHGEDVTASHNDSIRMLDYGFEKFEAIYGVTRGELLGESKVKRARKKDTVVLAAAEDVTVVVPKGTPKSELELQLNLPDALYAPLKEGQVVASVTVLYQGQALGTGNLATLTEVKRSFFWPVMALGDWLWGFVVIRVIVYLLLSVLLVIVFLFLRQVWQEVKRIKRKPRRRR